MSMDVNSKMNSTPDDGISQSKYDAEDGLTWNVIIGHNSATSMGHISKRLPYSYVYQFRVLLVKAQ
jgi:hypothetical protein